MRFARARERTSPPAGSVYKRMMGLEPTTFCMAKGSADQTTPDATDGIRVVLRNRLRGVVPCRFQWSPRDLTWDLTSYNS